MTEVQQAITFTTLFHLDDANTITYPYRGGGLKASSSTCVAGQAISTGSQRRTPQARKIISKIFRLKSLERAPRTCNDVSEVRGGRIRAEQNADWAGNSNSKVFYSPISIAIHLVLSTIIVVVLVG